MKLYFRLLALSLLVPFTMQAKASNQTENETSSSSVFFLNDRHQIKHSTGFPGDTFEAFSAFLYGGNQSYASQLRALNQEGLLRFSSEAEFLQSSEDLLYFAPQYRVQRGDTFQSIGAHFAGGSAMSYLSLIQYNPHIEDWDHLMVGTTVTLSRIPTPDEQLTYRVLWCRNFQTPCKSKAPIIFFQENKESPTQELSQAPVQTQALAYAPTSSEEMLALLEWYLKRLDIEKDRDRLNAMVSDLITDGPKSWKAHYTAGQYSYQTGEYLKSVELFKKALKDEDSPIQVAFFYFKALRKTGEKISNHEEETLLKRFPALQGILSRKD
jgi:tetratricopeptide (TPR) repeat protein